MFFVNRFHHAPPTHPRQDAILPGKLRIYCGISCLFCAGFTNRAWIAIRPYAPLVTPGMPYAFFDKEWVVFGYFTPTESFDKRF